MKNIVETPNQFITRTNHTYPPGNNMIFEEYFFNEFSNRTINTNRLYIPVLWTNFYISRGYATQDMSDLQFFLDSLPRDDKYFTVVQWDDGIKNNLNGLDIISFASGGIGDYPIPLINKPHIRNSKEKNIFASFIGNIQGRHGIREKMRDVLSSKEGYFISESVGFENFKDIMERSIFSLCPRGYGKTSFRINESLNLGSIPVYIYDDPWIPFNDLVDFREYGVLISESELIDIDNILKSYTDEDISRMLQNGKKVYDDFYTYESCFKKIIEKL
jgi:hypothetical protein